MALFFFFFFFFFEGLYSQKIKPLKNFKIKKTRKIKSLMEEELTVTFSVWQKSVNL